MSSKIFLVGLPGSGKSTFGKELAKKSNLQFIDLDEEIVASSGYAIPTLFEEEGEKYFRELESRELKQVIKSMRNFVLSTGGGTPCFFDNMKLMNETGITIYVNTSLDEIQERLSNDSSRPLLQRHTIEELFESRKNWYEQAQVKGNNLDKIVELLA